MTIAAPPTPAELLDAARRYRDAGLSCIPLEPGTKDPDYRNMYHAPKLPIVSRFVPEKYKTLR